MPQIDVADILVPRRDVTGTGDHNGVDRGAPQDSEVGYRGPAAAESVCLAREVALERTLPICKCDLDDFDVMDYVRQGTHLDARRFGLFPEDGRASCITVNGKSRVSVYGTWSKRADQWGKPTIIRSQMEMDMAFLRDRDERDYVNALELFVRDHTDGHARLPGVLPDCLLSPPYNRLPFLAWSRIWREAAKYEAKHRMHGCEAYFVGWYNCEFFMIPCEECSKLYVEVPSWWRKYKPCRGLLVPTSPLFSYLSSLFIDYSALTMDSYRAARADYCVMVLMVFLQWVHLTADFFKLSPVHPDPRMLVSAYKGVLYPLPDAVVRFALAAGIHDIVAKTRYSLVLAHAAIARSPKVDWSVEDCPSWYRYDYRNAAVCGVPPTRRRSRTYSGSRPRVRAGVKVVKLVDIQAKFDPREAMARERLAEAMAAPVDEVSSKAAPVEGAGRGSHTADSRYCRSNNGVDGLAQGRKGVCGDEPVEVDALAMSVDVLDTVSVDKAFVKDRSGVGRETEAPVTRTRSSQATGDIEVIETGKSVGVEKPAAADEAV